MGIDSAKLSSAKENMSGTLGEMAGVVEEEDELAGTWVFNITISSRLNNQISVNFTSNGVDYEAISDTSDADPVDYLWYGRWTAPQSVPTVYYYDQDVWTNISYRTITITSKLSEVAYNGDVLLAWLKANATKQTTTEPEVPEEPTTDELAGTWVFDELIDISSSFDYSFNFLSNDTNFVGMYASKTGTYVRNLFYVGDTTIYVFEDNDGSLFWNNAVYRTITITSNLSEVTNGEALLTWLKANATKQTASNLISFTIDGTSYQAEEGMTWAEWCDSDYNTADYTTSSTTGVYGFGYAVYIASGSPVTGSDVIVANQVYVHGYSGGAN